MGIKLDIKKYKTTLKKVSSTDRGMPVIDDEIIEVYNFDKIKEEILKQVGLSTECKSCDGLIIEGDTNILIEFKNVNYKKLEDNEKGKKGIYSKDKPEQNAIKKKAFDSKFLLNILRENKIISSSKDKLYIVYKDDENKSENKNLESNEVEELNPDITKVFYNVGQKREEFVAFGLEKMKGKLYEEIHTYNKEEFITNFVLKRINTKKEED